MSNEFTATLMAAGTVESPTLFWEEGTGFFKSGTGKIGFASGSAERITFAADSTVFTQKEVKVVRSAEQAIIRAESYRDSTLLAVFRAASARGTIDTPDNLNNQDYVGMYAALAWQSGTTFTMTGCLTFVASQSHASNALGTECRIYVTANNTTVVVPAATFGNDLSFRGEGSFAIFGGTPPATQVNIDSDSSTLQQDIIDLLVSYGFCTNT